ncbi:sodium transporter [Alkalihalobacillus alcalophilus ATCC 27647 = CGMCC 1.3604]|uniref:Sodium ion/putative transporter n=1 Tax=Alkalihalobacillus alcalophilus ATCC 27647 = CGMCC 1.3604 TaxID=1218173 RepID=J8THW2_ALKAL|nr:bile acid:sodium symporter family protein [Alkalihalobacillus alcalophilus]AFV25847.1 sodium ion/putative transporter [Alkalihalobacillus alcalophilus ATCC 27647 = CGMCC 1.3604]MED1563498.1 bile acid:sodium symporter family protein [Alkalihalobacillus alcalophilus]THG90778.1 sodium transporter [Alkalihalobacillus alcalophilus ATCC 27647 = CGMCC 1.3604]
MKLLEAISSFAGKYFVFLVIGASVLAFFVPEPFLPISSYVPILLGIIMFGMGMTLKPVDFKMVAKHPLPVVLGLIAQFTIMPLTAFAIAYLLNLPAELAAGLVLLGSVPGGTSSNVMVYLAKGDLPLSITMTSFSTLVAPLATPAILYVLANQWMPVHFWDMFTMIVQVIIIPVSLGLIIKKFLPSFSLKAEKGMPLVSVLAVLAILSAVVAANQATLMEAGLIVFLAVILHNAAGLTLGYAAAAAFKLSPSQRRAVSIEIGMQNTGLGATLATAHLTPFAAIPSVIGAAWHNFTGTILATYWSRNEIVDDQQINQSSQPEKDKVV